MNKGVNINPTSKQVEALFISSSEVAEIMGISRSRAYKVIKVLNDELRSKGFITISGKVSRKYFMEKVAI